MSTIAKKQISIISIVCNYKGFWSRGSSAYLHINTNNPDCNVHDY